MASEWKVFKKERLDKLKSAKNKGEVDSDLIGLLNLINSCEEYCSLSSCSGRIVVVDVRESGDKLDARFAGKWHNPLAVNKLKEVVKDIKKEGWFKVEPPILHIACESTESAKELIKIGLSTGFKRSGIISLDKKRTVVELASTECMELPLAGLSEDYLKSLVEKANRKLLRGKEKLKRLKQNLGGDRSQPVTELK